MRVPADTEGRIADARQLRRLLAYNEWADGKILAAIDRLAPEELTRSREAYFGTLADNLRHTLVAQRVWLARWHGEPPRYDEPITGPWRAVYATTHAALRAFVATLSDAEADRAVRFTDMRGTPRQIPLAQAITHLVNHGTAHRAETGLLLERLGRSPGDLDYSYFCFEHP